MSPFRDTFKTAGEIRAAAFAVSHPELSKHEVSAAELHDSICKALPSDCDCPASVSRAALELVEALRPFAVVSAIIRPDLPDDTEIVLSIGKNRIYSLALGSLRAAQKALYSARAGQ